MRILVIALLKQSQVKYKIIPLSLSDAVDEIYIIRKYPGPSIEKVRYFNLPAICRIKLFNLIITPFILFYKTKKLKPDLLLSYHFIPHGFFGWLISSLTGVPFIYSQIDIDIQKLVELPFLRKSIVSMLNKACCINVPGSKSRDFWIRKGIDPQQINILHSTIDTTNDYYPIESKKNYDFIYVGVLEKRKGVHLMLETIAELKNIGYTPTLLIVGDGEQRTKLENLMVKLKIENQVTFTGHSNQVFELVNQSRFYLLTSRNEGIPCAMMEAMACGVVPISVDVADVTDIVKDGSTGFLVSDYNIDMLTKTLVKALDSVDFYSKYSLQARQIIVAEHSYMSATKMWKKVLSSLNS